MGTTSEPQHLIPACSQGTISLPSRSSQPRWGGRQINCGTCAAAVPTGSEWPPHMGDCRSLNATGGALKSGSHPPRSSLSSSCFSPRLALHSNYFDLLVLPPTPQPYSGLSVFALLSAQNLPLSTSHIHVLPLLLHSRECPLPCGAFPDHPHL